MTLDSAHRGYEFQDLLVALRLVDVMLGSIQQIYVDKKLILNDRFDDLTTVDATGRRERVQIKHTDNADRPLTLATFTNDSRGLQLNRLISAALEDRKSEGSQAIEHSFRIVMRDAPPNDTGLLTVLRPANPDPGPFLPGMNTVRMRFSSEALWQKRGTATANPLGGTVLPIFLQEEDKKAITRQGLDWVCQRLIVEVGAPAASLDLTRPSAAERLLLERVGNEVGAGIYPNADRTTVDVAESLIRSARVARQGALTVTTSELLRRAQLRSDFGAVARAHPVDKATEVPRPPTVAELIQTATAAADRGKPSCSSVHPDKGSRGSVSNWYSGSWMRSGSLQSTIAILVTRMANGVLASSQSPYSEVCWDGSSSKTLHWLLSSGQDSRPPSTLSKMRSSLHSGISLTAVLPWWSTV